MMRTNKLVYLFFLAAMLTALISQAACGARIASNSPKYPDQSADAARAVEWMVGNFQNDDGGYASFSAGANQEPSSVAATLDAVLALASAGYDPAASIAGKSATPIGYLMANVDEAVNFAAADGGQAGKLVLALIAAGVEPRIFPAIDGVESWDLVKVLTGHTDASGAIGAADPFKQSLAMLGLVAAGETVPAEAIEWLESRQADSGSWDDGFGTVDSADVTAMATMALLAAGREPSAPSIQAARQFLATSQVAGGWEYGPGLGASANSTAVVIQALAALGEDFYTESGSWVKEGRTPLAMLLSYQGESGAFQADFGQGRFDDFYSTVQSIPAVSGCSLLTAGGRGLSCLRASTKP